MSFRSVAVRIGLVAHWVYEHASRAARRGPSRVKSGPDLLSD